MGRTIKRHCLIRIYNWYSINRPDHNIYLSHYSVCFTQLAQVYKRDHVLFEDMAQWHNYSHNPWKMWTFNLFLELEEESLERMTSSLFRGI